MKYFISSLGFWSKNVTSILDKNILLLNKKMYSIQLCTVNLWLYVFVMFMCIIYSRVLSTFDCILSEYFCQVDMYSMEAVFFKRLIECCLSVFVRLICTLCSCVLSTFDCMLSVCLCHVYVYYIQLCVVNLSLYVICMFCQVNMYSMQLCVVYLWLYVVCMFLSCLCVLYTAVCCQPFIVCYLYVLSG
jgi:hypothetical protein